MRAITAAGVVVILLAGTCLAAPCGGGRPLKACLLLTYDPRTTGSTPPTGFLADQAAAVAGVSGFSTAVSSYATAAEASTALASGACDVVVGVPVLSSLYDSTTTWKSTIKSPPSHVANAVVVATKGTVESKSQWLAPFSFSVWILLLASTIIHAIVIWLLESRQNHANFPSTSEGLYEALVFSATTLLGFADKPIRTACGRAVLISWYLLAMIMFSTYNASLTNILAIDYASTAITTEADVRGGKAVCVIASDNMLTPMKVQFTTAVEAGAAECLTGTTAGKYAATVGLETTLQPTASPNCGQLYLVNVEQQYSRSFTWAYRAGLAAADRQCLDASIASQSGAALGTSKYYRWPDRCKPDGSMTASKEVTLEQMAGQYGLFFCVCALATIFAGVKALCQVFEVWPGTNDNLTGQHIWSQSANEAITTFQAQQIVDQVLYTHLDLMRADICDDICNQFGGNPQDMVGFARHGSGGDRSTRGDDTTVGLNMVRLGGVLPSVTEEDYEEEEGEPGGARSGGGLEGFASAKEALDYHGPRYFKRYDMNNSGLIDTAEELKSLTTNLVYKLELAETEEDLYQKIRDVDFEAIDGWNYPTFGIWFNEKFIESHLTVSETIGQSIRNASRKAQAENKNIQKDIR